MTTDLRRLLSEATPGPLAIAEPEECALGDGLYVRDGAGEAFAFASSGRPADARLIVVAVNALPALLDVADAARAYHMAHHAGSRSDADKCTGRVCAALRAALDKLEALHD